MTTPAGERLFKIVEIPAVVGLFAMMVHTVANAFSRTVFGEPITGTLERVQYWYMPLVVLLGFVIAMHRGEHVWADMFFTRFPRASKRYVAAGASIVCAAVCILAAVYSFAHAQHNRAIELTAGLTDIAAWPLTYLVPITFAIFGTQYLVLTSKQLRNKEIDDAGSAVAVEPEAATTAETETAR
ncbi:TRAP transporter small permease [Rhodococcus sp. BP-252]|uniref:Tripartite ATP-independent periplasmic transporters DctQ component domain-containing protein n=1 Tax=Rhodococcoides kyotonense TaxID=398843 RepID=A0A177YL82_9NOCA|nr:MULTISPECIES: TRAP transporter small permease [Rhodococcus]MBY6412635.1 TRAP transporter small permease [Rhodococcus sp. BP-320]MBY6417110.1 TRAP transporter small permease [Rhodococcus sp. BP-321]MBY6423198.1 TRAP transporter small permease [Rhodococcus sp. BP-324]MBY6427134.1 TRAP transporter small permease [Rhodococcus sp. BP-323]MBY6432253.1 TRAP transporter small permease [Rhodococcus sp. BP-322]